MENKHKPAGADIFDDGVPQGYVADILDNPDNVASATEMTGMLPTPPLTQAAAEGYNDLYAVPQRPADIGAVQLHGAQEPFCEHPDKHE